MYIYSQIRQDRKVLINTLFLGYLAVLIRGLFFVMILRKSNEINLELLKMDCREINANYLIHKKGVVISNKTNKILKPAKLKNGYLAVAIDGKTTYVHKLVGVFWKGKPKQKLVINHGDGIKINNHHANIDWVTSSYNNSHAIQTGLKKPFQEARGIIQYDLNMNEVARYRTSEDLEPEFSSGNICLVANGKRKTHKGYIFKFIN